MKTKVAVGKDMMLKLKESFSLKSFSSTSYHSSLIRNSKTIRLNVNLIKSEVSNAFSSSNSYVRSYGNSEWKNKSAEFLSIMKKSPKSDKLKELLTVEDSIKLPIKDEKLELQKSVKHSYQVESHGLLSQVESEAEPNSSEFASLRCDVCMKYFSSRRNVKRHSILHSDERHPCETCSKVFRTKDNLKRHRILIHEAKVKSFKCSKCYKAFSAKRGLDYHLKKHPDHVKPSSLIKIL